MTSNELLLKKTPSHTDGRAFLLKVWFWRYRLLLLSDSSYKHPIYITLILTIYPIFR